MNVVEKILYKDNAMDKRLLLCTVIVLLQNKLFGAVFNTSNSSVNSQFNHSHENSAFQPVQRRNHTLISQQYLKDSISMLMDTQALNFPNFLIAQKIWHLYDFHHTHFNESFLAIVLMCSRNNRDEVKKAVDSLLQKIIFSETCPIYNFLRYFAIANPIHLIDSEKISDVQAWLQSRWLNIMKEESPHAYPHCCAFKGLLGCMNHYIFHKMLITNDAYKQSVYSELLDKIQIFMNLTNSIEQKLRPLPAIVLSYAPMNQ